MTNLEEKLNRVKYTNFAKRLEKYIKDNDITNISMFFCNNYRRNKYKFLALKLAGEYKKIHIIVCLFNWFSYSQYETEHVMKKQTNKSLRYIINNTSMSRQYIISLIEDIICTDDVMFIKFLYKRIKMNQDELIKNILYNSIIYDNADIFGHFIFYLKNKEYIKKEIQLARYYNNQYGLPRIIDFIENIIVNKKGTNTALFV